MELLITPTEVLEIAFPATEQFREELIRPSLIEAAQLQHLKPIFGKLYDQLGESQYSAFTADYLKAPLAYYIRCMVIDEMWAAVGTTGILQGKTDYGSAASIRQQERLRRHARHTADRLLDRAIEQVESNPELFPEYEPDQNLRKTLLFKGGFVFQLEK